jgi:hypothetical protein
MGVRSRYLHTVSERLAGEPLFRDSFLAEALSQGRLTTSLLRKKLSLLKGVERAQRSLPYFLMTRNMVTLKLALEAELSTAKPKSRKKVA